MELAGFCLFLVLMMYGFGKGFSDVRNGPEIESPPWPYEIEDAEFEEEEESQKVSAENQPMTEDERRGYLNTEVETRKDMWD